MWGRSLLSRTAISRDFHARNTVVVSSLSDRCKPFSTESDRQEAAVEAIVSTPPQGLFYGRLSALGRNILRSDIVQLFEGCNLTPSDIRFDYNRAYYPTGVMLQFHSKSNYDKALRLLGRNRLYRLERADRSQWDPLKSYDGKAVLLEGIPRNALVEDVERFLSGCKYDASSIQMLLRPGPIPSEPTRFTLVQFPTQLEAMNALRRKSRGFCLNSPISMRLVQ